MSTSSFMVGWEHVATSKTFRGTQLPMSSQYISGSSSCRSIATTNTWAASLAAKATFGSKWLRGAESLTPQPALQKPIPSNNIYSLDTNTTSCVCPLPIPPSVQPRHAGACQRETDAILLTSYVSVARACTGMKNWRFSFCSHRGVGTYWLG